MQCNGLCNEVYLIESDARVVLSKSLRNRPRPKNRSSEHWLNRTESIKNTIGHTFGIKIEELDIGV